MEEALPITLNRYSYSSIPNLYTLLDASSMESSGILTSFSQPSLNTQGENTIIGIIDTGIDYRNPVFLGEDRSTRILGIWDQTIELNESGVSGERAGQLPEDIFYGTAYTKEDIDRALASDSPWISFHLPMKTDMEPSWPGSPQADRSCPEGKPLQAPPPGPLSLQSN